ncbi:MAG TPA: NADP-dependent oxidoreductase [Candidatus Agrococcus pullicola]|uniref:NADP-dependent oxidoreductase n=1 Tax=Candidatus Agrococcus pullicola TaxID=2838429 RepID=A0A9D1YWX5_9MICO|nr:NADP-dependent oxidoreductase [Candidatus Agrococcus pullicola]
MSRAAIHEQFGGPEVLEIRQVADPHAGKGQVRVRVTAAGLNPVDWKIAAAPDLAEMFGVSLPSGFGNDFAGVVDEVGEGVSEFTVGDRVYGGARGRAVADYVVIDPESETLLRTPEGVDDATASTLVIAGRTADAAISTTAVGSGDTVLVGGAAGGVGIFAGQLARHAGARVLGTGSASTAGFLSGLGVEPVTYGEGLVERVRDLAPDGVTAAVDLHGSDTASAAVSLGVPVERIVTIASQNPPAGVRAVGGGHATPGALERITDLIAAGELRVPIAATFPLERIHEAMELLREGHVHGKIVITLAE